MIDYGYDFELGNLVKKRKFVPYGLPRENPVYEVGKIYWCGYWHQYYKVLSVEDRNVVVRWNNGRITSHCTPIDGRYDYELRRFEWKDDNSPVNSGISLTFAEIRALCYAGVINGNARDELEDEYFLYNQSRPKGYVYYFLCEDWSASRKGKHIFLKRDLDKSPKK